MRSIGADPTNLMASADLAIPHPRMSAHQHRPCRLGAWSGRPPDRARNTRASDAVRRRQIDQRTVCGVAVVRRRRMLSKMASRSSRAPESR